MYLLLATEAIHKLGRGIKSDMWIRAWWLLMHRISAATELHTCHLLGQLEYWLYTPWSCVWPRLAGQLHASPLSQCSRFPGVHQLPVSIFSPPPCLSPPCFHLCGASCPSCLEPRPNVAVLFLPSDLDGKYNSNNLVPSTDCRWFTWCVCF